MNMVQKGTLGLALLGILWLSSRRTLETHDDAFTEVGLLERDASDLQDTIVTSHLTFPLAAETNVLWCASFQLAWNETCDLVGEDLHFGDDEPPMVAWLNTRTFTKHHLDEPSYVAVAGFVRDDIHGRIERELRKRFKGQATPRYIPSKTLTPRPQDIVAYSYLFKNLEFSVPFERLTKPIVFQGVQLPCFGVGEDYRREHADMLEQVIILDYRTEDDFIVELQTKGEHDVLILAKVQPAQTLDETIRTVRTRIAHADPVSPGPSDILKVPKLNFDITRNYREIEGRILVVSNPAVARDLILLSALQNIRFQLDEKGVRLRSESHLAFGCSASPSPPPPKHVMVFDKPFLIMLHRRDADAPYFACWVATPELLDRRARLDHQRGRAGLEPPDSASLDNAPKPKS
jgi:hypothetical protein